ncbi:unnamed protein product [Polarella glacialis]|uniref:Uncharacterized protein n=1 Tax=Polarella glacialis TaxID=89957 RepID=A0A813LHI4_POLGL|nr:unnamed protein product [Polarella glacialis]
MKFPPVDALSDEDGDMALSSKATWKRAVAPKVPKAKKFKAVKKDLNFQLLKDVSRFPHFGYTNGYKIFTSKAFGGMIALKCASAELKIAATQSRIRLPSMS